MNTPTSRFGSNVPGSSPLGVVPILMCMLVLMTAGCLPFYTIPPLRDYGYHEINGAGFSTGEVSAALSDCTLFRPNRVQAYKYFIHSYYILAGDKSSSPSISFTTVNYGTLEFIAGWPHLNTKYFGWDVIYGAGVGAFGNDKPAWVSGGTRLRVGLPRTSSFFSRIILHGGYRRTRAVGWIWGYRDAYLSANTFQVGVDYAHFTFYYSQVDLSALPMFTGEYSYLEKRAWKYWGIQPTGGEATRFHLLTLGFNFPN